MKTEAFAVAAVVDDFGIFVVMMIVGNNGSSKIVIVEALIVSIDVYVSVGFNGLYSSSCLLQTYLQYSKFKNFKFFI